MYKKGFTLVEVVVAAVIIALVAGGMFGATQYADYIFNRAWHKIQAYNFAREAFDKLRSNYTYDGSEMDVNLVGAPHEATEILLNIMGKMRSLNTTLTYEVTEPQVDGYKKVVVTVSWDEPTL